MATGTVGSQVRRREASLPVRAARLCVGESTSAQPPLHSLLCLWGCPTPLSRPSWGHVKCLMEPQAHASHHVPRLLGSP